MICYAQHCEITVLICRDENDKEPYDMEGKCNPPLKDSYERFQDDFP